MSRFLSLIISGCVTGSVYALMAVGLVIIYRACGFLNFAHGYIVALAPFLTLELVTNEHLPWIAAIAIAIVAVALVGGASEALVAWPLRGERASTLIAATFGLALIVDGLLTEKWGAINEAFPFIGARGGAGGLHLGGGIQVSDQDLVIFGGAWLIIGLISLLFYQTTFGLQMRAASESREAAGLLGVRLRSVSRVAWIASSVVGAGASVLVAPLVTMSPESFNSLLLIGLFAVVLAGFTSILGAIIGAYAIGVAVDLFSGYVATSYNDTFTLGILLAILLLRPNGLFGRAEVRNF